MKINQKETLLALFEFLGVGSEYDFDAIKDVRKNRAMIPRSKIISRIAHNRYINIYPLHRLVDKFNLKEADRDMNMNTEDKEYLIEYFRRSNQQLEKFLQREITAWEK
jgi:hypothetical protein